MTIARCLRITLSCTAILWAVVASAQLATLKEEGIVIGGKNYRLYVRGNKTPILLETSSNAVRTPTLEAHKTRGGIVYGWMDNTESGAILVSTDIVFIQDKRTFLRKDGYSVKGHHGESILLVPTQSGPWLDENHALLYEKGKFLDVGFAHEAGFDRSGKVVGWYYALEDGRPSSGLGADFELGTYKQYFEFKNGMRKLKGRKPIT